jgi:2-phospho-L-lactate guanylyltransferase (CobY/MobA/RfbA family)
MTIVTDNTQFINSFKTVTDNDIVLLSRCLTDKCSECSGTYVSTTLHKRPQSLSIHMTKVWQELGDYVIIYQFSGIELLKYQSMVSYLLIIMRKTQKKKKSGKLSSARKSTSSRSLMLGNVSADQLNSLLSIRKFEKKNFAKIGKSGVLARTLAKEADAKKEFLSQNSKLMIQEYSKAISQITIPASVPLKLPSSVVELIKKNKIKKVSVAPNRSTNTVNIAVMNKSGEEKILVNSKENSFKNHPQKDGEIGIVISQDSNLSMSIPSSPLSLESNSSRNQGTVMYKLGIAGADRNNV